MSSRRSKFNSESRGERDFKYKKAQAGLACTDEGDIDLCRNFLEVVSIVTKGL